MPSSSSLPSIYCVLYFYLVANFLYVLELCNQLD